MEINLLDKPFELDANQQDWVYKIFNAMTEEEKIGQILCPSLANFDEKLVEYYTKVLKVGAVMIRPFEYKGLKNHLAAVQRSAKIPLLISANLENGGCGAIQEGTLFANPLGCAATGKKESAYRLGKISCKEAANVGINWGFAPIIDIDLNYHNPITNTRTFGSNPKTVLEYAKEYIKAAKEEQIYPTIKHFPGDGVDERDQHLLVSVNDLDYEKWMNTYGRIYKSLIEEGVPAVMSAHIAAPYVAKAVNSDLTEEEALLPASQSKTLMTDLLRTELGFNGLIVTDSTLMVGYMQKMPRREAIPRTIESGADMILFHRSIEEDIQFLKEGIATGILSKGRLDEAVLRVLALKAKAELYEKNFEDVPEKEMPDRELFSKWTKECANQAVTLVKDAKHLLPLSAEKRQRVYLNVIENTTDNDSPFALDCKKRLEQEGFTVTLRKRKYSFDPAKITLENWTPEVDEAIKETMCNTAEFVEKYDMAMIVLNMQTASNATVVRVNWNVLFGMGNDLPWYAGEMPLLVVSVNNPYHLLDIPMAHTYVNAYTNNKETLDAVFDKLMGRSEFVGESPVDPFCGKMDTR